MSTPLLAMNLLMASDGSTSGDRKRRNVISRTHLLRPRFSSAEVVTPQVSHGRRRRWETKAHSAAAPTLSSTRDDGRRRGWHDPTTGRRGQLSVEGTDISTRFRDTRSSHVGDTAWPPHRANDDPFGGNSWAPTSRAAASTSASAASAPAAGDVVAHGSGEQDFLRTSWGT